LNQFHQFRPGPIPVFFNDTAAGQIPRGGFIDKDPLPPQTGQAGTPRGDFLNMKGE
jgi:hypothetical protein